MKKKFKKSFFWSAFCLFKIDVYFFGLGVMKKTLRLLCCICAFSLIESASLGAWWPFGGKSKTVKTAEQTKKKPWYKKLNPFKRKKKKPSPVNQDMAGAAATTGGATAATVQDRNAQEDKPQQAINQRYDPDEKRKDIESSNDIQREFENAIRNQNKAKASAAIDKMPEGSEQASAAHRAFLNTFSGRILN